MSVVLSSRGPFKKKKWGGGGGGKNGKNGKNFVFSFFLFFLLFEYPLGPERANPQCPKNKEKEWMLF